MEASSCLNTCHNFWQCKGKELTYLKLRMPRYIRDTSYRCRRVLKCVSSWTNKEQVLQVAKTLKSRTLMSSTRLAVKPWSSRSQRFQPNSANNLSLPSPSHKLWKPNLHNLRPKSPHRMQCLSWAILFLRSSRHRSLWILDMLLAGHRTVNSRPCSQEHKCQVSLKGIKARQPLVANPWINRLTARGKSRPVDSDLTL